MKFALFALESIATLYSLYITIDFFVVVLIIVERATYWGQCLSILPKWKDEHKVIDDLEERTVAGLNGLGSKLTNVVISAANNYDFNTDPSSGYVGYLENSGSTIYNITPTTASIEFRKNGSKFAEITDTLGFSGSLYGIGDVLAYSGSVASRLLALETTIDAGTF